jgi:uncharacterized protein (TIGR00299 family) protein
MTTIAYLDCVGGLAGDMLVAALLDAGAPASILNELPTRLGIGHVRIDVGRVERQGVGALHVTFEPADAHVHQRDWRSIRALLERAELDDRVRARALSAFARLAEAEAGVHGVTAEDVHFHELGAVDTLMDICGAIALFDALGIDELTCSALPVARGQVEAAHGVLPLPAPATLALLRRARAQIHGVEGAEELVTPTGAALAAELVSGWGALPPMTLEGIGVGAGTRHLPQRANVVRLLIGVEERQGPVRISLLETNLDDFSPELVPDAADALFAAGALDVWTVPAQMKKGRPGLVMSALCRPAEETPVATAMLEHTSALGVRVTRLHRYELEREIREFQLDGGIVRVKIGRLDGRVVNVAPEHDDCAEIARRTGRSVKSVWAAALAAAGER